MKLFKKMKNIIKARRYIVALYDKNKNKKIMNMFKDD